MGTDCFLTVIRQISDTFVQLIMGPTFNKSTLISHLSDIRAYPRNGHTHDDFWAPTIPLISLSMIRNKLINNNEMK